MQSKFQCFDCIDTVTIIQKYSPSMYFMLDGEFCFECIFAQEGSEAIDILNASENIVLDGVYSAKAFAGLLQHIESGMLDARIILFWNTFCADSFEDRTKHVDPHSFYDERLRAYFIQEYIA